MIGMSLKETLRCKRDHKQDRELDWARSIPGRVCFKFGYSDIWTLDLRDMTVFFWSGGAGGTGDGNGNGNGIGIVNGLCICKAGVST